MSESIEDLPTMLGITKLKMLVCALIYYGYMISK